MKKTLMTVVMIAVVLFAVGSFAADKAKDAPSAADQAPIMKVVEEWKAATVALDFDKALALYSDKFSSYEYGDKAGLASFLKDAKGQGELEGMTVDASKAKVDVDKKKNTASVTGIEIKAKFGAANVDLELAKDKDNWVIKGMEVQMQ